MVKTIDDIQDELLDNDYRLSPKTIKDLAWHLENDDDPHMAVVLATDAKLKQLSPLIVKHLDHEDWFIRERTIGCVLDRLKLAEYAEKGLEMAQHDESGGVRNMAVFSLGAIINEVSFSLAKKIAQHLLKVFKFEEIKNRKDSAYFSILKAMEVPWQEQPSVAKGVKPEEIDQSTLESFCKKYQISMQEVS